MILKDSVANYCFTSGKRFVFVKSSSYYRKMSDVWFNMRVFKTVTDVSTKS